MSTIAKRAEDFIQSIGANTHLPALGTPYANTSQAIQDLTYLGVHYVRDTMVDGDAQNSLTQLAQAGFKLDLAVEGNGTDLSTQVKGLVQLIDQLEVAYPGSIASIEGPNEVNIQELLFGGASTTADPSAAVSAQKAVYSAVMNDPALKGIPLLNLSVADTTGVESYVSQLGNMASIASEGNWHLYFSGDQPEGEIQSQMSLERQLNPGQPVVITETGYTTDLSDPNLGSGVDANVQMDNTLNDIADAFADGVARTYIYQLMSGGPSDNSFENGFALFDTNGNPSPLATAIHNMTAVLSDPGSGAATFAPGSVNYTISNLPSTGRAVMLEKSNATFDLMVWNEPQNWNPNANAELPVAATSTTINLGATYSSVEVFDPTRGASPIETLNNVSSVAVGLADHPLIVQVSAGQSAAGVTPAPSSDNTVPGTALSPVPPTFGTGSDKVVLSISEDAWANGGANADAAGDARFIVKMDGAQIGGTLTATASHGLGEDQLFTFLGNFGPGLHDFTVQFLNDAWGGKGTVGEDRNLYVDAVAYNGVNTHQSAALLSNGTHLFHLTGG